MAQHSVVVVGQAALAVGTSAPALSIDHRPEQVEQRARLGGGMCLGGRWGVDRRPSNFPTSLADRYIAPRAAGRG